MAELTSPITITTAQTGTTDYGPWAIAGGEHGVKVRFFRNAWPNVGRVLTARLAFRGDGQTFSNTWTLQGGDAIGPDGVQTHTEIAWDWPGAALRDGEGNFQLDGDGRRIRRSVPVDQLELAIRIFEPVNTVVDVESY